MNVNEIFSSIDGEGLRSGALATFVRLSGCNLRCSYCDTEYAQENDSGTEMPVAEIVEICDGLKNRHITLTGGEPLVRKDVVRICERISAIPGIEDVALTTNGLMLPVLGRDLVRAGATRINLSMDTLKTHTILKNKTIFIYFNVIFTIEIKYIRII